ncbi:hypothetical protein NQS42_01825 [Bacillus sp. C10(2022)]|uniref:hypothetical protein n=1 Tax=Bacillus sp. C10(2022) TaxID=2968454 RepID=UPI00330799D7
MKWIYKYDDDFIYVPGEDICIENDDPIPSSYTDIKPRDGLYIGKFTPKKNEWIESATQEHIEKLKPPPSQPDPIDLLKKQNAILSYEIAKLQKAVAELSGGSS